MTDIQLDEEAEAMFGDLWSVSTLEGADAARDSALSMIRAATCFLVETEGGRNTWYELTERADAIMVSRNFFLGGSDGKTPH